MQCQALHPPSEEEGQDASRDFMEPDRHQERR